MEFNKHTRKKDLCAVAADILAVQEGKHDQASIDYSIEFYAVQYNECAGDLRHEINNIAHAYLLQKEVAKLGGTALVSDNTYRTVDQVLLRNPPDQVGTQCYIKEVHKYDS